jgi:SAM-dependent methyltransferase
MTTIAAPTTTTTTTTKTTTSATAIVIRPRDRVRDAVPWWAKGMLKLAVSKLPVSYGLLRKFALARHGAMLRPGFAYDAFRRHFDSAHFHRKAGGFTTLELGPGDSLFTALTAWVHGGASTWLVDVAPFAGTDLAAYRAMSDFLRQQGLAAPDVSAAIGLEDVLSACNARYETRGLASLRAIPDNSIDFAFSNTVLQHVALEEFDATLAELKRVLHPNGCCVHSIDLRDMLAQSLHHLKFSARTWESRSFRNSGFYTNRLRLAQMLAAFRLAGFETDVVEENRWPALPVGRGELAEPYRSMPDDELLAATVRVVCRPTRAGTDVPRPRATEPAGLALTAEGA